VELAMSVHLRQKNPFLWKGRKQQLLPTDVYVEREFCQLRPALGGDSLVVYDVGASVGVFSACLAKLPNVKTVHAFEPIPESFEALTKRVGGRPQVQCHNVALSDEAGVRTMSLSWSADSSSMLPPTDDALAEFPGMRPKTDRGRGLGSSLCIYCLPRGPHRSTSKV
jgi:hypothetical protein